jgi:hypothetical protein
MISRDGFACLASCCATARRGVGIEEGGRLSVWTNAAAELLRSLLVSAQEEKLARSSRPVYSFLTIHVRLYFVR